MKLKKVNAAELMKYNANTSGKMTPDCVKRSISLALDQSYTDVARMLNAKMKELHKQQWNIRTVYEEVIRDIVGSNGTCDYIIVPAEDRVLLSDFVDNEVDTSYIYLVQTGSNKKWSNHLVCIRDGKVWDSWDSRDQWVIAYFLIKGYISKQITNIKDDIQDIAMYTVRDLVNNEIVKYMKKRNWDYGPIDIDVDTKNYQINIMAGIMLRPNDIIDKKRYYDCNIALVISPTMTLDEAKAHAIKATKQKVYDRMWAINEQEKKLTEEYEMIKQMRDSGDTDTSHLFMDNKESRFFYSLPGWVRPLVTYLNIQEPGQYSDSYTLTIRPLPSDKRDYGVKRRLDFEAYDASQLRDMLDRYKNEGEVPFLDYSPEEEY